MVVIDASLENKLAMIVWYLEELRSKRIGADTRALDSYLDDREVQEWLDKLDKQGRIVNTRFTRVR